MNLLKAKDGNKNSNYLKDMITMKKGPLITSIILLVIGLGLVITGAITYTQGDWADWTLWSGLFVFNIGLIILVTAFIKKPSAETEESITDKSSN